MEYIYVNGNSTVELGDQMISIEDTNHEQECVVRKREAKQKMSLATIHYHNNIVLAQTITFTNSDNLFSCKVSRLGSKTSANLKTSPIDPQQITKRCAEK